MKYTQQTLVALLAFLLIGLASCAPEKDPELIETMTAEADSVQADIDVIGNAKQRLGGIMRAMQSLTPEQRDTIQTKIAGFETKINDVLNAFSSTPLPELDSLSAFRLVITDYENGVIKKKDAKAKLESFRQAISGIKAKVAALDEKVAAVETEMPTILPVASGMSSALPQGVYQGTAQQAPASSGAAGTGGVAPAGGTSMPGSAPSATTPSKTGGSLVAPEKKQ